ncbi:MAG: response regulator transcription factor [Elusimicrobia bacterium]|nr:response regulator transcription factor [Elusimicrobiota bacterium]
MEPQRKILLLEDDRQEREGLSRVLTAEGFRLHAAETLEMGRHLFSTERPDLIIADVGLPDGTGLDFCRHVRAHPELGTTPIIMLTGKGAHEDKTLGFQAGADQYLVKPVLPSEVLLWVQALLRRLSYDQGGGGVLKAGDLEIDPKAFTVRFQGNAVPQLTIKEFELLYFLVRATPQVLTRKHILSNLWHTVATDHLVDNHMMRLRRRLPAALADRLQAVPGKGYRYFE